MLKYVDIYKDMSPSVEIYNSRRASKAPQTIIEGLKAQVCSGAESTSFRGWSGLTQLTYCHARSNIDDFAYEQFVEVCNVLQNLLSLGSSETRREHMKTQRKY